MFENFENLKLFKTNSKHSQKILLGQNLPKPLFLSSVSFPFLLPTFLSIICAEPTTSAHTPLPI